MAVRRGKPLHVDISKIQPGSVLRVKSAEWWNKNKVTEDGRHYRVVVDKEWFYFNAKMAELCGECLTVEQVYRPGDNEDFPAYIDIVGNDWHWLPDYFDKIVKY